MDFEETAVKMFDPDYKERFRAEYFQLLHRRNKLVTMLDKWEEGTLEFVPTCPIRMLDMQLGFMEAYISVLQARAKIEGVDLSCD